MNNLGIKTVTLSSKTICDLITLGLINILSVMLVSSISCKDCKLKYISETSRNINKHLYEHKRNIRLGNLYNALFLHISKTDHNFDFNAATMFAHFPLQTIETNF